MINDGAFELVKNRSKGIMLVNEFKKFEGVSAIRVRDEELFIEKLKDHCNTNQPFLFGCDSCNVVTKFYHACIDALTDQSLKAKFILITADTLFRVNDATKDFKDKFVFYSPKITFGVDFSLEVPQDVFIYIAGNSIQPSGCYQQATRCRNIKNLYYFGEVFQQDAFYHDLEDVKSCVGEAVKTSKTFNTTCTYIDEHDELQVVRNTFFNLYCYNEFVKDIYETNKVKHFELILTQNGFVLSSEGSLNRIAKETKQQQKHRVDAINDDLFNEFLESDHKSDDKFQSISKAIEYLKVPMCPEYLIKFKGIILDKWKVKDHDAIIRFLKSDEYLEHKMMDLSFKGIDVKLLTNNFNKLKIIREFETEYGINIWSQQAPTKNDMTDELYNLIRHVFRTTLSKPTNDQELIEFYGALVKSATTRKFINISKGQIKINTDFVHDHLELNNFKNVNRSGFSQQTTAHFGITEEVGFVDASSLGLDD